jgi:hypothetical protein
METDTSFRFGKNLLTITPEAIILKKIKRSKATLIFWTVLMLSIIAFTIIYIIRINLTRLRPPQGSFDRLLVIAVFIGILYFIFHIIRESVNECKTYVFDLKQSQVIVNCKLFSEHSKTELKILKSIGWEGLGESYKICLASGRRHKIISFGNSLTDARSTASIIGQHLNLEVKQKL